MACGDDHVVLPVISSEMLKRGNVVAEAPLELKEYEYYVGHAKLTAMLTEEMADRLQAVPVGEGAEAPQEGAVPNRTAEQLSTHHRQAEDDGVDGPDSDGINKARNTRNRRAH